MPGILLGVEGDRAASVLKDGQPNPLPQGLDFLFPRPCSLDQFIVPDLAARSECLDLGRLGPPPLMPIAYAGDLMIARAGLAETAEPGD
jgi:hypothetical protein